MNTHKNPSVCVCMCVSKDIPPGPSVLSKSEPILQTCLHHHLTWMSLHHHRRYSLHFSPVLDPAPFRFTIHHDGTHIFYQLPKIKYSNNLMFQNFSLLQFTARFRTSLKITFLQDFKALVYYYFPMLVISNLLHAPYLKAFRIFYFWCLKFHHYVLS